MTSLEGTYYDKFCAEKARAERLSALLLDPPPDVQELVIKKLDLVHRSLVDAEKARADLAERKAELYRHEKHAWDKTVKERDEARAACAEMRQILSRWAHYMPPHDQTTWAETFSTDFLKAVKHALSTNCGSGWLSTEKARLAREALEYVLRWWDETGRDEGWHQSIGIKTEQALAALKDSK